MKQTVWFISPFNALYIVNEYDYASFHSLSWNNIGDAGCAALSTALQECKELQQLK